MQLYKISDNISLELKPNFSVDLFLGEIFMCGIVRKPAKKDHFEKRVANYRDLPSEVVLRVASLCEEAHLSEGVCEMVLRLASYQTKQPFSCLPFAIYANGKRYTSPTSLSGEADAIQLAMAESVRELINEELATLGIRVVMGHCCDIQKHSVLEGRVCMDVSHDRNLFRAARLRNLTEADCLQVTDMRYLELLREHEPNSAELFEQLLLAEA